MTKDDRLLRRLGALASEQQQRDDVAGDEHAALDELARERIVGSIVDGLARDRARRPPARWRSRAVAIMGAVAVAATLLLVLARSWRADVEPLPLYALSGNAASTTRGEPAVRDTTQTCRVAARREGSFELLGRTDEPVKGPIQARAFLVRDGEVQRWPDPIEVSAQGSVRILDLSQKLDGASELRLVIYRAATLTDAAALAKARDAIASGPGWQVLQCRIEPRVDP